MGPAPWLDTDNSLSLQLPTSYLQLRTVMYSVAHPVRHKVLLKVFFNV